ncbi:transglycosylase family protein [Streptomyces sp. NPDC096097]|uniref:transglycosylase family protein n=1 Tax=Streptomyces sp. NPDC096097 TaxID=3155546 RepID=UPI0033301A44
MTRTTRHLRARIAGAALGAAALLPVSVIQADAASVSTWDKVAECESSGNWSYYRAGWPYFGGLQFSLPTWRGFGGEQYASYPHQATKQQQILIAEKVLAVQGQGAWPNCGPAAGLGSDHADPYPGHKRSTAGVYRPSTQVFSVSDADGKLAGYAGFGVEGDAPLTGDWNKDGKDTFGVYRPETHTFLLTDNNSSVTMESTFGDAGDVPLVGDWDGDGKDTIGVYRPGEQTFYLTNDNLNVARTLKMGDAGDKPITGDWNGDGKDTVGIYRPANQTFYLSDSSTSADVNHQITFGSPGDLPIKGDWNGDGTDKIGVYRPTESDFFGAAKDSDTVIYSARFGNPGDIPTTGQW